MVKKQVEEVAVQEVAEESKFAMLNESELLSNQKDHLLIARRSSLPGWTCNCGWPIRPGLLRVRARAQTGRVKCPHCGLEQIDQTQSPAEREQARADLAPQDPAAKLAAIQAMKVRRFGDGKPEVKPYAGIQTIANDGPSGKIRLFGRMWDYKCICGRTHLVTETETKQYIGKLCSCGRMLDEREMIKPERSSQVMSAASLYGVLPHERI